MHTTRHTLATDHPASRLALLQKQVWCGALPLEIRLAAADCRTYTNSDPYLILYPRLSYLAFLLPRLHAFFAPSLIDPHVAPHAAWLEFEGVPLKWHYPSGLLFDLFSDGEPFASSAAPLVSSLPPSVFPHDTQNDPDDSIRPWKLTIHYADFPHDQLISLDAEGKTIRDWFVNAVKEADYTRNGSARSVMSLSREDSDNLWLSVQNRRFLPGEHFRFPAINLRVTDDMTQFNAVHGKLLNPPGLEIRHVPVKFYLPTAVSPRNLDDATRQTDTIAEEANETTAASAGHFRIVQALVPLQQTGGKTPQTLGTALNMVLPTVFPSRRNPLLAQPVLHGTEVPMSANMLDISRAATYPDGFLHIVISMLS